MGLNELTIKEEASLKDAIRQINQNRRGFVCVIGATGQVLGTITDGDIRRAILKDVNLGFSCTDVMNPNPVMAKVGQSKEDLTLILREKGIRNLPILDEAGQLVEVVYLADLLSEPKFEKIAVIMAGGEGRRLRPFTENIPKPMLEVDGRPILEHLIENLKGHGFNKFYLSVNYLSEVIENHFGTGEKLGVSINYLREKEKLGTAGALSMLPSDVPNAVLVLNGDVLSDINFQNLLNFHVDNDSAFTMAASRYKFEIPFGVLQLAGNEITGVDEKPTKSYLCNAGIYVLSPDVISKIPKEVKFDMTDLLSKLIKEKLKVKVFPLHEYWLDIGRKEDLLKAQENKL